MAKTWIKMRTDLIDDPAVICMADALNQDLFFVIGRLQVVWSWFDEQSRDGHAHGVTQAWLNTKTVCDGFAQAMCKVGWLLVTESGISLPNFERHNGNSAKVRALGTGRQQAKRSVSKGVESEPEPVRKVSRTESDISVTREEKRRVLITPSPRAVDNFERDEKAKASGGKSDEAHTETASEPDGKPKNAGGGLRWRWWTTVPGINEKAAELGLPQWSSEAACAGTVPDVLTWKNFVLEQAGQGPWRLPSAVGLQPIGAVMAAASAPETRGEHA
jgi:hypothetical protein